MRVRARVCARARVCVRVCVREREIDPCVLVETQIWQTGMSISFSFASFFTARSAKDLSTTTPWTRDWNEAVERQPPDHAKLFKSWIQWSVGVHRSLFFFVAIWQLKIFNLCQIASLIQIDARISHSRRNAFLHFWQNTCAVSVVILWFSFFFFFFGVDYLCQRFIEVLQTLSKYLLWFFFFYSKNPCLSDFFEMFVRNLIS